MTSRKTAFILANTDHGTMIVNRLDFNRNESASLSYGVGYSLLEEGCYDPNDVRCLKSILSVLRQLRGDGIMALDVGANIGVHTLEWARHMTGWGSVLAVEAQERIFYALAGNIALNNCFNATALNIAMADTVTRMKIPQPDYTLPGSFGSLELQPRAESEFIGQEIRYDDAAMVEIETRTIDSLALGRLDLLKIDVEGMEMAVLHGARTMIARHRPVLFIEHIKLDFGALEAFIDLEQYQMINVGMNMIAYHRDDPVASYL